MNIDLLNEAFLLDCRTNVPIHTSDIINVNHTGEFCFKAKFDQNINVDTVWIGMTTSGTSLSSYYINKDTPKEPAFLFPHVCPEIPTSSGFYDVEFNDIFNLPLVSGTVCSGFYFNGSEYLISDPFVLVQDSYTVLFNINPDGFVSSIYQSNLFFQIEGISGEILSLGFDTFDGENKLTVGLTPSNGIGMDVINTGMDVIDGVNTIAVRGNIGGKLRLSCNRQYVEINKPFTFLGNTVSFLVGGKQNVGYFKGSITDGAVWVTYVANDIIEQYMTNPRDLFFYEDNYPNIITTSSGYLLDFPEHAYPYEIYTTISGNAYTISSVRMTTFDDVFVLCSGVDELYCGTAVRGLTDTRYELEVYNNSPYKSYGYVYAFDGVRYKALKVSEDGVNFTSNQITIPGDISWDVGDYNSGVNSNIALYDFVDTGIYTNNAVSVYDRYRRVVYKLMLNSFTMIDLRTGHGYTLPNPSFLTGTVNFRHCVLLPNYDSKVLYCMYRTGLYAYDIVAKQWGQIKALPNVDYVRLAVTDGFVAYSYKDGSVYKSFIYDESANVHNSVREASSLMSVALDNNYVFIYIGRVIFKYSYLPVIPVDQSFILNYDVSNVIGISSANKYIVIMHNDGINVVTYTNTTWDTEVSIKNITTGWISSYSYKDTTYVTYNISNKIYFEQIRYVKYIDYTVNVYKNYLNTLSLSSDTVSQYNVTYGWLYYDDVPTFHIASKYAIDRNMLYGFIRDSISGDIHSYFMVYITSTDSYIKLSDINGSLLDVNEGIVVDTFDCVYYLNLSKQHYYKYNKSTDIWEQLDPPSCGYNVVHAHYMDAVFDMHNTIYIIGTSGAINDYYRDTANFYAFYGYVNLNDDKVYYIDSLHWVNSKGWDGRTDLNGNRYSGGETSFITYYINNSTIFMGWSHYVSKSVYYIIDSLATRHDCVFNKLCDLYDFGCRIYLPMTNGISRNLMLEWYAYDYYTGTVSSDIPNRNAINGNHWYEYYIASFGKESGYNFSVNLRCKVKSLSIESTVIFSDVDSKSSAKGLTLGLDNEVLYVATRSDDNILYDIGIDVTTIGIGVNDWIDVGFSIEYNTTASGIMKLYVNGIPQASGILPSSYEYSSEHTFFTNTNASVLYGDGRNSYANFYVTEVSYYTRILSETEFYNISYTNTSKPLGPLYIDYGIQSTGYTYQPHITMDNNVYYYNVYQKYLSHSPQDNIIYMVGDRSLCKYNLEDDSWQGVVITKSHNHYPVELYKPRLIGSYDMPYKYAPVAIVTSSELEHTSRIVFDSYDYVRSFYVDSGAYVTPIIDTKCDSMFMYELDVTTGSDSYVEVFVRYANYPPLDYAHICYCDSSSTFREMSIATGRVFYSEHVDEKYSCAVYYDSDVYKVTFDGKVYINGAYGEDLEVYTFSLLSYDLEDIRQTWFSPNGSFILYWLLDGRLAAFPLGLGYACSVASVRFNIITGITWNIYSDEFSVCTDQGIFTYNYRLGLISIVTEYSYILYSVYGEITIDESGAATLVRDNGVNRYRSDVIDIDVGKDVYHDYRSGWVYYISYNNGQLKKFRLEFIDKLITHIADFDIFEVTKIESVSPTAIAVLSNGKLVILSNNGNIVNDYSYVNKESGGIVYHRYDSEFKVKYYSLDYIYRNDLIWFDSLDWIPLKSKLEGVIRGKRYVQFKIVLHANSGNDVTPLVNRVYVGTPVRIGPVEPYNTKKFHVNVDIPVDDSADVFSTSIITYFETLLFDYE